MLSDDRSDLVGEVLLGPDRLYFKNGRRWDMKPKHHSPSKHKPNTGSP